MPDSVYFESSVFLAIFMGEASGPSIKALLRELKHGKVKIYTSIITIQEVSVQSFRKGMKATDNYSKVYKFARIETITKEIALTAAKLEAQIIDDTAPKDREDNKRRKWDCIHMATAMELGCRTFYSLDEGLLKRKKQLGITGTDFSKPVPRSLPLFADEGASAVPGQTGEADNKQLAPAPDAKSTSELAKTSGGGDTPDAGQVTREESEDQKGKR